MTTALSLNIYSKDACGARGGKEFCWSTNYCVLRTCRLLECVRLCVSVLRQLLLERSLAQSSSNKSVVSIWHP